MRTIPKLIVVAALLVLLLPVFYMLFVGVTGMDSAFLKEVFSEPYYLNLLLNTLLIAGLTTLGSLLIGIPTALLLGRFNLPLRRPIEYLCLLPLLLPPYFTAIAWVYLLGNNGSLTNYLKELFQVDALPFTVYGVPGTIFVLILCYFPLVVFLTLAGLRNMDSKLEDAGNLVASRGRVFRGISLPLLMPYVSGSALLVFVLALNNFDVPSILLVNVYPWEVFNQFSVFYRPDRAMLISLPLIIMALGAMFLWYRLFRDRPLFTISGQWKRPVPLPVRWWMKIISLGFIGIIIGLAVALPLGSFINQLGPLTNLFTALQNTSEPIINSIMVAALAALLALVLGVLAAYGLERAKPKIKGLLTALLILPLIVPGVSIGIGLIYVYNQPFLFWIYKAIFIVILGLAARFVVIPTLIFSGNLKMLDPTLENAAIVAGVPWYRRWFRVILPLVRRSFVISAIICFILALNELAVSIMVNPPGFTTLSVRIYSLFHFNQQKDVAALCLIMVILVVLLYLILSLLFDREKERDGDKV